MESGVIKNIVENGIKTLYRRDAQLVNDEIHEQSISAKLMCYIQCQLPEWDVDVEYNRQGKNRGPKTDDKENKRKPDIIIHKRGEKGPNLAVILVKCSWNEDLREKDESAVLSLKTKHDYKVAFLLEISKNEYKPYEVKSGSSAETVGKKTRDPI